MNLLSKIISSREAELKEKFTGIEKISDGEHPIYKIGPVKEYASFHSQSLLLLLQGVKEMLNKLQWENSLIKDGAVIKNAKNGGYVLNDHQVRMDKLFDDRVTLLTEAISSLEKK